MKRISKKSWITMLCVGLVLALTIGATLAYLMDVSDPIRNEFKKNSVDVSLEESDNEYEIIPGTEDDKDPTVSGSATLPAYVFVKVDDETQGLVTYSIADGWTAVPGVDGVYYREVPAGDFGPFSVLDGDKVTYSPNITNEMMAAAENGVALTFTAYACQKEGFDSPEAAWAECAANATPFDPEDQPDEDLPQAQITEIEPPQGVSDSNTQDWTGDLDVAVQFAALEDDVSDKEYKDWAVDFALSFNKDIVDGSKVHLFGSYAAYQDGAWIGDDLAAMGKNSVNAGEEFQIMDAMMDAVSPGSTVNYNDIVTVVRQFNCGIAVEDGALGDGVDLDGLVVTVKLIMTDGEGGVHEIDQYQYSYPG